LSGIVGEETFGFDRFINQIFYKSQEWKSIRDFVIVRDTGCDLGVEGYDIYGKILIHHMNPISKKDIESRSRFLLDPEYLICTSHNTHNAIHYGDDTLLIQVPVERNRNDTCPWKYS
jgi:predicted HNH restriction endonuclease